MFQRAGPWSSTGTPGALAWQFKVIAVLGVAGVVLGAWYMLWLVQRVFFGPVREPKHDEDAPPVKDLGLREVLALAPLGVFIVWIGVQPEFFLDRMAPALEEVTARVAPLVDQRAAAKETVERGSLREQDTVPEVVRHSVQGAAGASADEVEMKTPGTQSGGFGEGDMTQGAQSGRFGEDTMTSAAQSGGFGSERGKLARVE
jgi:NADH-quinone oxidoreductase subunit M